MPSRPFSSSAAAEPRQQDSPAATKARLKVTRSLPIRLSSTASAPAGDEPLQQRREISHAERHEPLADHRDVAGGEVAAGGPVDQARPDVVVAEQEPPAGAAPVDQPVEAGPELAARGLAQEEDAGRVAAPLVRRGVDERHPSGQRPHHLDPHVAAVGADHRVDHPAVREPRDLGWPPARRAAAVDQDQLHRPAEYPAREVHLVGGEDAQLIAHGPTRPRTPETGTTSPTRSAPPRISSASRGSMTGAMACATTTSILPIGRVRQTRYVAGMQTGAPHGDDRAGILARLPAQPG